ncbi:MAG: glycosyltransferase family 1 protein [Candidatus Firestonebacteria bacterium]
MKLAINATMIGEKQTGSGVYSLNILKELSKNIHNLGGEVVVYTAFPEGLKGLNLNIKALSKNIQPRYNKKSAILRFIWSQVLYPGEIKKEKYNLVYNTTHHGSLFIDNQILTILDLLPLHFPRQHILQHYYFKYILPEIAKKAKKIITISNNTKMDILKYYKLPEEKVKVVLCGYDKNMYYVREDAKVIIKNKYKLEDYILIVGTSYPHKNVERVLNAYSTIKTNTKLVIVGNGKKEYRKLLIKTINNKGLNNKVIILDLVTVEDLPYLYSAAKLFVFASLYEGFGLPTLEAMACGIPTIISNTSSFPEVGGDAAYYIDPYNELSIVGAMNICLSDNNLRNNLISKGLERVKLFSWEKAAKEIIGILKEVNEK